MNNEFLNFSVTLVLFKYIFLPSTLKIQHDWPTTWFISWPCNVLFVVTALVTVLVIWVAKHTQNDYEDLFGRIRLPVIMQ